MKGLEDGVYEETEAEGAFPVGSDRTGQNFKKGEMKSIYDRHHGRIMKFKYSPLDHKAV